MPTRREPPHARLIGRIDGNEEIEDGVLLDEDDEFDNDEAIAYRKFRETMRESEQYPSISVSRQPMDSDGRRGMRKLAFLFEVGLDDYEYAQLMTKIRDEYGSGSYRLQGRDPNGRLLFNKTVHVEAPAKPDNTGDRRRDFNPDNLIHAFSNALAEHQARTEQMLERMMKGQGSGQGGMFEQFVMFAGVMKEMQGLFGGSPGKPGDALTDLKRLAEFRDAIKSIGFGDSEGGNGSEKNIHDTIGSVIHTLGPMLQAGFTQMAAQQSPRRRLPNPTAGRAIPAPTAAPTSQPQSKGKPMGFAAQIGILVANAKAGVDPVTMAESVLELTPENQFDSLREFVNSPDVIEKMKAANSEVSQYPQWFETLRDNLREFFLHDPESGDNLASSDVPAEPEGYDAGIAHDSDT
jgi:hypothetical protein